MPPPVILHGATDFLVSAKPVFRPRGLDSLTLEYVTSRRDRFFNGGAPPGYPHMRIKEVEPTEIEPGLVYDQRLTCEGLLKPDDKTESKGLRQPESGWDEGPMTILTLNPDVYQIGMQHPTIDTLWAVAIDEKDEVQEGIWRVRPLYKGIVPVNGVPKGRKRTITNNAGSQRFGVDAILGYDPGHTFTPFVDEAGTFSGWETAKPTTMDTGRVVVVDTFLTTTAPPTDKIPGNLTPANAPVINDIFGYSWMTFEGGVTYNWPWGWVLKGIQSEQLLDKDLWLTSLTTEFVPKFSPNG